MEWQTPSRCSRGFLASCDIRAPSSVTVVRAIGSAAKAQRSVRALSKSETVPRRRVGLRQAQDEKEVESGDAVQGIKSRPASPTASVSLHCSALPCSALPWPALSSPALRCPVLPGPALCAVLCGALRAAPLPSQDADRLCGECNGAVARSEKGSQKEAAQVRTGGGRAGERGSDPGPRRGWKLLSRLL